MSLKVLEFFHMNSPGSDGSMELMPVVILAGGLATRLRPLTDDRPKALIEVAGRPFLWHQLTLLKRHGVRRCVIAAGYLGEKIQERFGDGADIGVALEYSFDGAQLLGTAGAIRKALPLLPEQFFVLYGDAYLDCDYRSVQDAFLRQGLPGLMTVYRNADLYDPSNVEFDGAHIRQYDKQKRTSAMQHIDYGLGAFHRSVFATLPAGEKVDLAVVYQELQRAGNLAAFEVFERFYEIGSVEGLQATEHFLRNSRFSTVFLEEVAQIAQRLDVSAIDKLAASLVDLRDRDGRLFILGVGGSAANASHAVNDFRKLAGIETYSPTDNVSELTARTNDEGWPTVFVEWLRVSRLRERDAVLVFSVGGGSVERNVSPNIVSALEYAKSVGATILGIVGRDGGYTARVADACVVIPPLNPDRITPHTEAFQAVVWHLLVSHPALQKMSTRWESLTTKKLKRAVFLDRDGVLNEVTVKDGKPYSPAAAEDLRILPGTAAALSKLRERGFLLLVVTNQPEVARGRQKREVVEEMNRRLRHELLLDDVFTCFHDDKDACDCRKPRPGLVFRAAQQHGVDIDQSFMAGDRWRDVEAGANAGCKTIWIDRGYSEQAPAAMPDARVSSLPEAVDWILKHTTEHV